MSRFSFVANLLDVSLNKRVNLLDVDFAGFVMANLKRKRKNCFKFTTIYQSYSFTFGTAFLRISLYSSFVTCFLL
jgi:hypothetical protein